MWPLVKMSLTPLAPVEGGVSAGEQRLENPHPAWPPLVPPWGSIRGPGPDVVTERCCPVTSPGDALPQLLHLIMPGLSFKTLAVVLLTYLPHLFVALSTVSHLNLNVRRQGPFGLICCVQKAEQRPIHQRRPCDPGHAMPQVPSLSKRNSNCFSLVKPVWLLNGLMNEKHKE